VNRTRILALVALVALVAAFLGQTGCTDSSVPPPSPIFTRAPTSGGAPPQLPLAEVATAIERLVGGGNGDLDIQAREGRDLALYRPSGYRPLWVDAEGGRAVWSRRRCRLTGADRSRRDYGRKRSTPGREVAAAAPPASGDVAGFDVRLSLGMLR
jgi:hypothetical protein